MQPRDFWDLHPVEFHWLAEGHEEKRRVMQGKSGKLTHEEALQMKDELRHKRVKDGYPPE